MVCDLSDVSDISSLSCLDQCFRADCRESFFLAVCSGLFVSSTSSTVCPTELSLCVSPARGFWQLCSGRKALQCLTGWHPLPGCSNTDKPSSSWTKCTECESSSQPAFRCLISETLGVLTLGFMDMGPAPAQWCSRLNFSVSLQP